MAAHYRIFLLIASVLTTHQEIVSGSSEKLPEFTMRSQRLQVPEGDEVRIPCTTDTTYDIPMIIKKEENDNHREILLFVGDTKTVRGDRYTIEEGQVTIYNVMRADAGPYLCYYQDNADLKLRHFVEVQYPPTIHSISPIKQKIIKGSSVTLQCTADGNPKPRIFWSKQGGLMPSGEKTVEGFSLTLDEVTRHVEGQYTCTADNGVGNAATLEKSVEVEYAPEIIIEKEIIRTGENDKVELICIVHARPSAKVVWHRDGIVVRHRNRVEEHNRGHKHLLIFSPVTRGDFGIYECKASNLIGVSSKKIEVTDKPESPQFTSNPSSAHESSYTLTWDAESYYPITKYRIRYRKKPSDNTVTRYNEDWIEIEADARDVRSQGSHHSLHHRLLNLVTATDYEAAVQVRNKFRWGSISKFNFSTRKEIMSLQTTSSSSAMASSFFLLMGVFLLHFLD